MPFAAFQKLQDMVADVDLVCREALVVLRIVEVPCVGALDAIRVKFFAEQRAQGGRILFVQHPVERLLEVWARARFEGAERHLQFP